MEKSTPPIHMMLGTFSAEGMQFGENLFLIKNTNVCVCVCGGVLYVLCVPICIYACMLAMPQLAQNSCRSWCSLLVSASVGFPSGYWLTSLWESRVSASHLYIGCADVHHHMWLFVGSGDQMQDVGLAWCVFLSTVFFQGQYFRDLFSLWMTKLKGSEIESLLQFQWPRAHQQRRRIMSSLPPHSSQVQWSRLVCCCLWCILERGQVESCGLLFQVSGGLWAAAFSSAQGPFRYFFNQEAVQAIDLL